MLNLFKKTFIWKILKDIRNKLVLGKWFFITKSGSLTREEKYRVLLDFQKRFSLATLVETGTYFGDTMEACKHAFGDLYSIELDQSLWQKAHDRFVGDPSIRIMQGDSSKVLPEILPQLSERVLFWLDGHYSGGGTGRGKNDTPIVAELKAVFDSGLRHYAIIIDDARLFIGRNDYPTMGQVEKLVKSRSGSLHFEVQDDLIKIFP